METTYTVTFKNFKGTEKISSVSKVCIFEQEGNRYIHFYRKRKKKNKNQSYIYSLVKFRLDEIDQVY